MSIAYYDAIIAKCTKKIAELEDSKNQVINVLPKTVTCSEKTLNANTNFSNLVFFTEMFGKNEMEKVSSIIDSVESNLNSIIEECNDLIEKYTAERETAEAAKASLIAKLARAKNNLNSSESN